MGVERLPRILVVEDDPSLRTVIRLILEQGGYEIAEASNGRVALEQLGQIAPDLVLVDSKMPFVTGAEMIARMKAEPAHAAIPVILLTGLPHTVPRDSGADAIVAKPFEKGELLSVIDGVLRAGR